MIYKLPSLPYQYGALEPYIDALTMEIHHSRHHQGYVDNLNRALSQIDKASSRPLESLLQSLDTLPDTVRLQVRNNGGGHSNHTFFWLCMKAGGGGQPKGSLSKALVREFEHFDNFVEQFSSAAKTVFGSGWAWLVMNGDGRLVITTTSNQDSPLMYGGLPIMGLDVWEHAYYLKYQNRRPDYIAAWWHVINWDQVEQNYEVAKKAL